MRALRRWVVLTTVAGLAALAPGTALANGGAYIAVDGTHFLPGTAANAEAYVFVPRAKQRLLDRGPFFAYLVPEDAAIEEGEPVPAGAVRVGTFEVERSEGKTFELGVAFTVPALPSAFYSLAMCNEPCTLSGFREPLTGLISIVATRREGDLLTQQVRLQAQVAKARRDARRAARELEEVGAQLAQSHADNRTLSVMVNDLLGERDAAENHPPQRSAPAASDRPLIPGWAAAVVALALLLLAASLAIRGRRAARMATASLP